MKFKLGDKVYCHTDVIMEECGSRCVTAGKSYEIIHSTNPFNDDVNKSFFISNDDSCCHCFSYATGGKWFIIPLMKPTKQIKKFKL